MIKNSLHFIFALLIVSLIACQTDTNNQGNDNDGLEQSDRLDSDNDPLNRNNTGKNNANSTSDSDQSTSQSSEENVTNGELNDSTSNTIFNAQPNSENGTIVIPDEEEEKYNFHEYKKLNTFLSTYVTYSGKVNYSSIKSHKSELIAITKEFEENYPASDWSNTKKLTYWINAYNIYTIQLIVDNYPTSSITKITAKPWHKKFIKLGGKSYCLNMIENDIIRKKFNDPCIHFALNCASTSCPVLLNKAYTPSKLNSQLASQTRRFLKDSSKNQFSGKNIKISKIFDWYKEDFTKNGATVIDFINKYRTEQLSSPTISYMDYSWDLNK